MAEWLGRGLQNLLHRFESGSDLKEKPHQQSWWGFVLLGWLQLAVEPNYNNTKPQKYWRFFFERPLQDGRPKGVNP